MYMVRANTIICREGVGYGGAGAHSANPPPPSAHAGPTPVEKKFDWADGFQADSTTPRSIHSIPASFRTNILSGLNGYVTKDDTN